MNTHKQKIEFLQIIQYEITLYIGYQQICVHL